MKVVVASHERLTHPAALLRLLCIQGAQAAQHGVHGLRQVVQRPRAHGRALVGAALQQQGKADGAPGSRVRADAERACGRGCCRGCVEA